MKIEGTRSIMIQQKKIEATENQLKVIKDKYLKDSPSVEAWLENIAENIALAEILYANDELRLKAFEGTRHTIVTADGPGAVKPNMVLFHQGLNHDQRHENHRKFIENLYRLAKENTQCADIVRETADRFYNLMDKWELLKNSTTLMNAGRKLQQLSACYVLPVGDSIEEIYESVKNMALIHKSGGYTGFDFSHLRPAKDTVFSTKGVASGPLSFMSIFDKSTEVVKQGGQRRGANMGIMRYDHPSILDFIHCKRDNGFLENFNISVALDAKFMDGVKNNKEYDLINPRDKSVVGKLNAREVFDKMCKNAWVSGDPGYVVIDRINNSDSNPTPAQGQIESTNPCVTGDTLISTEHGLVRMEDLAKNYSNGGIQIATDSRVPLRVRSGNNIILMNQATEGMTFNEISQAFCSGTKDVYLLRMKNGSELKLTEDHKVITKEGFIKVKDLTEKDEILLQKGEGRFGKKELDINTNNNFIGENGRHYQSNFPKKWSQELGQVLGWLIGDGWLRKGDKNCRTGFTFSKDDQEVLNYLKPIINEYYGQDIQEVLRENGVYHLSYHSKYFI